jgi:hypothetical protein
LNMGSECGSIGEMRQVGVKSQHPGVESRLQTFEKQTPEQWTYP